MSYFHVLEGFQTIVEKNAKEDDGTDKTQPQSLGSPASPTFMGAAVWMREEQDDPEDLFEYELTATPPGGDVKIIQKGTFRFEKVFHRSLAGFIMNRPWAESGHFVFRSKIRRVAGGEWLTQDFPIPIEVIAKAQGDS